MKIPKVICIGVSAGGVQAIQNLFLALGEPLIPALVIVQHLPENAHLDLDLIFGRFTSTRINEVVDKMPVEPGKIYFAPAGYHLQIEREGYFSLSWDEPVHYARPAIDVLFESAAWAYGGDACGIILTGANSDGAQGLAAIHEKGGLTLVQDLDEAEVKIMPRAALEKVKPDYVLPLQGIGDFLRQFKQVGAL